MCEKEKQIAQSATYLKMSDEYLDQLSMYSDEYEKELNNVYSKHVWTIFDLENES